MSNQLAKARKQRDRANFSAILAMPWGGERNKMLRSELNLKIGEVGMVNNGPSIMIVVQRAARVDMLVSKIKYNIPDAAIRSWKRDDGRYVIAADCS